MSSGWVILLLAALALLAGGVVLWLLVLRRYVCLRRADCCGRGCGCVFPVKRK